MMGKQHQTFPNEPSEMPVPKVVPEVNEPTDPKEPDTPQEDPYQVPDELPSTGDEPKK
jgi:hypothetical protein